MGLKLKYFAVTALFFFTLSLSLERQAHAYADPGSTLLAFQSLSALVTGALFYWRRRLKSFFVRSDSARSDGATKNS